MTHLFCFFNMFACCRSAMVKQFITIWFTSCKYHTYECKVSSYQSASRCFFMPFLISSFLYVLPLFYGHSAFARPERTLCLQRISKIRCSLQPFFVTLRYYREVTPSRQKKKRVSLFCSRLFVTLRYYREVTGTRKKKETSLFCSSLVFS